jgi:RNA-binding protein
MGELILSRDERLALKGQAHHLNPVVLLGAAGLTDAVVKEIDRALKAHELIKIRVPSEDREQRDAMFADLAERLDAARVQMIGKLLVLFRPRPDELPAATEPAPPAGKRTRATPASRVKSRRNESRPAPPRRGGHGR